MPNPGRPLREHVLPLSDDLRVYTWRDSRRDYKAWCARIQKFVNGDWRNAGPFVRGSSDAELLGKLSRAYRETAELIDSLYKVEGVVSIDDGCPDCGYSHPRVFSQAGGAGLSCPICQKPDDGGRQKR